MLLLSNTFVMHKRILTYHIESKFIKIYFANDVTISNFAVRIEF